VQGHVRRPQHVQLEPIQLSRHLTGCIVRVDDDSAKHEDRVLGVDASEAVVAGFVKEEVCHRPTLGRDGKPLKPQARPAG